MSSLVFRLRVGGGGGVWGGGGERSGTEGFADL